MTFFGRDGRTLAHIAKRAIDNLKTGERLEAISFGSARGQQGYDLAMSIAQYRRQAGKNFRTNLIISDIDPELVDYARWGIYFVKWAKDAHQALDIPERGRNIDDFSQEEQSARYRTFFRARSGDTEKCQILNAQEWEERHGIHISFKTLDITDERKLSKAYASNQFNIILARNVHYEQYIDTEHRMDNIVLDIIKRLVKKNGFINTGYSTPGLFTQGVEECEDVVARCYYRGGYPCL